MVGRVAVWAAALVARPTPPAFAAGGPSSLSGKPRPETGVILLEPVMQSGKIIVLRALLAPQLSALDANLCPGCATHSGRDWRGVLLCCVQHPGKTVSAELLAPGLAIGAAFESPYPVAKGNYYDFEAPACCC